MYIYKKVLNYITQILPIKTSIRPETTALNIDFKQILNKFHQDFFIKKTIFTEYKVLKDVIDDYNNIKQYINKSRFLFEDLYYKYTKTADISGKVSLVNILSVLFKAKENIQNNNAQDNQVQMNAKMKLNMLDGGKIFKTHKLVLYNDVNDELNDELYDIYNSNNIKNAHTYSHIYKKKTKIQGKLNGKTHTKTRGKLSARDKTVLIIENIHKGIKDEIKFIEHINHSL